MLHLTNSIKTHRTRLKLTQAQLADMSDVSRKTINTIENGVFIPSTVLALKIARALEVSLHDVFALEDDP
jgi:putative transcriptional regulator